MAKEFKTYEELIELMERRGIATDENTIPMLKRESYYAVINGYKDPFLDRDVMKSSADDVYLPGTSFKRIYDLFMFDRHLRQTVFQYITSAEAAMKSAVVYAFCDKNRDPDDYLERSNYCRAADMLVPKTYRGNKAEEYSTNMANLMKILNGKITNKKKMRPFVRHYLNSYGKVPLWVLQNDLTFGNIAHFYQLQKRGVQNVACKIIGEVSDRGRRVSPHDLLRAFDVLVGFRNICGHDERLYCAEVKGARFAEMFDLLCLVLPLGETTEMINVLNSLFRAYTNRIDSDVILRLAAAMGIEIRVVSSDSPV